MGNQPVSKLTPREIKLMKPTIKEMHVNFSADASSIIPYDQSLWETGNFQELMELGKGASCRVCKVITENEHAAALKEMEREDEFNPSSFVKEIVILHRLVGHPNILMYEQGYIDPSHYFIQTGLLGGGELFDRIHEMKRFSMEMASQHICRILDAILHCHNHQICHRDLKPENIVYAEKGGGPETLTIIDFGDAKQVDDNGNYEEFVGTAYYLPPEIVRVRKGHEMKKSDVWSIGVITYVLLTGRPPFWGNTNKEILRKIIKGKVQFPKHCKLSATAKHFVLNLVQKRIEKRYSIEAALKHPFIRNHNRDCLREIYDRHGINQ